VGVRTPGEQFLRYFRTRVPWVIAIAAVVAAASTGTYWATTRIRSLDTDLSTAGETSRQLGRQVEDLKEVNDDLRARLVQMEQALNAAGTDKADLAKRYRDLRNCVSKSNPDGGPIVTLIPNHGPVGTRVEMVGYCFRGSEWQRKYPASPYGVSLIREIKLDDFKCELIAGGRKQIDVKRDGRMRGYFVVAGEGDCFQSSRSATVTPGSYFLTIGCHTCSMGNFRVTTAEAERNRLKECGPRDFGWSVVRPEGPNAAKVVGLKVYPVRNVTCRLTRSATVSIVNASGTSLNVQGNSAVVEFDGAIGRQRVGAAWAWTNWCGTGSYRVRATLGAETKTSPTQTSGPRCDFKKYQSRLRPVEPLMEGVRSFSR
jgi:hypothetical protein